ncbi:MAG: alginate biosynthesis protein [Tabrizicola sp.]|nr:alginate biosynthesis protein [Tabrizicola sp.]
MTFRSSLLALASGLWPLAALAEPQSAFDCSQHEFSTLPAVEGSDGVFYRVQSDLRLQHPMDDIIVERLAELSQTLAEGGTTLIFVNVPTKGQGMPGYLPERAAEYGFDQKMIDANYLDVVDRLTAAGVVAPDLMTALRAAPEGQRVFFGTDFHWTPDGARLAAEEIGKVIRNHPAYQGVTPVPFETVELPEEVAFSGMRRELQGFCTLPLPEVRSKAYRTTRAADPGAVDDASDIFADAPAQGEGTLDIFGTGEAEATLVLVGTSFSDSPINNFAGFLSEYSGIEVVNYAITGGNQFGSMTSYLTSTDFAENRPTFLIWENPIYNSLAQYGPLPMDELVAAAGAPCETPLEAASDGARSLTAALEPESLKPGDALLFDFGGEGPREIVARFTSASGIDRTVRIDRGDRLRATGRFFLRVTPYWLPDLTSVSVEFDRPLTDGSAIKLCPTRKGDKS